MDEERGKAWHLANDVDVGGNVSVFGTTGGGEVIEVLGGDVRLDGSFNAGGDTVVLDGDRDD